MPTAADSGVSTPVAWDQATALRLRAHGWRASVRHGARPRWWLLAAVFLLHAVFVLVVRQALVPAAVAPMQTSTALQARFVPILLTRAPPPPPPPVPTRPHARAPAAHEALTIQMQVADTTSATPTPLIDRDGAALLPAPADSGALPSYVQRLPQGDRQVMRHADPVPYKATPFEKYFPPPGETAGGALVRRVKDAVVKSKDVDLPRGIHLQCMTVLGIPTPNCKMPPAGPSAKDGDERLSMAPAKPLAADPQAPPAPSVAACIAMYRAGKPLAWGCPVDTPNRAVDAERRQRAAGTDGRH